MQTTTAIRHETEARAIEAATRLVTKYPGRIWFVVRDESVPTYPHAVLSVDA